MLTCVYQPPASLNNKNLNAPSTSSNSGYFLLNKVVVNNNNTCDTICTAPRKKLQFVEFVSKFSEEKGHVKVEIIKKPENDANNNHSSSKSDFLSCGSILSLDSSFEKEQQRARRRERRRARRRERKRRDHLLFLQENDESIPLPETCGLSLSELEAMAARQARQLETQEQLLAAKAQRLRYLKSDGEAERLQRLRDKVMSQEERLRKLRALRGKVQTSRNGNSVLSTDLESLRAVFNEKEKELSLAVAKVDELTRQLEDLRRGSKDQYKQSNGQSNVAVELDKLRRELVYRQKLREAQATRVAAQRAALSQRQDEAVRVDRRIAELQERLHRKRLLNHQLAATIKHQENVHEFNNGASLPNKNDPKYQTLPYNTKFTPPSSSSYSNTKNQQQQPLQVYNQQHQQMHDHQHRNYDQLQDEHFEKSLHQMQLITLEHQQQQQQQQQQQHHQFNSNYAESAIHNNKMLQMQMNNNNNFTNNLQLHQLMNQTSKSTSQLMPLKQQQQHQQSAYNSNGGLPASHSHSILKSRPVLASHNNNSNSDSTVVGGIYNKAYNNENAVPYPQNSDQTVFNAGKEVPTPSSSDAASSFSSTSNDPLAFAVTPLEFSDVPTSSMSASLLRPALPPKPVKPTPPPRQASLDAPTFSSSSQVEQRGSSSSVSSDSNNSSGGGLVEPDRTELPIKPKPLFPKKSVQSSSAATSSSSTGNVIYDSESNNNNTSGANESATVRLSVNRRIEMPPAFLFPESDPPPSDLVHDSQSMLAPTTSTSTSTTSATGVCISEAQEKRASHGDRKQHSSSDMVDASPHPQLARIQKSNQLNQQKHHPGASSPVLGSASLIEEYKLPDLLPSTGKSYNNNAIPSTQTKKNQDPQQQMINLSTYHLQYNSNNLFLDEHYTSSNSNSNLLNQNNNVISSSAPSSAAVTKMATITSTSNSGSEASENSSPKSVGERNRDENTNSSQEKHVMEMMSIMANSKASSEGKDQPSPALPKHESKSQLDSLEAVLGHETCSSEQPSPDGDGNTSGSSDSTTSSSSNSSSAPVRRLKKGNLKTSKKEHPVAGRRVSFDPLALLLDASLEGEFDLVVKTAGEVPNPSAANDEGITALHNGICAGHAEVVRFLVEFGCDVNAQDSDGWTPLHCAASCNNVGMVKFLVERGACIFATTLSDHDTAAEKCEADEDGFGPCTEYLYSIQEKLGIINGGVVYAVYDYDAQNPDELSFHDGDRLVILRKGDECEREWWWASLGDTKEEGYVPRNLLGLYPRVVPQKRLES